MDLENTDQKPAAVVQRDDRPQGLDTMSIPSQSTDCDIDSDYICRLSSPDLNANDVIMGRGSGVNLKQGNIQFRNLVLKKYQELVTRVDARTKGDVSFLKKAVAHEVLDKMKTTGRRFLRKTLVHANKKKKMIKQGTSVHGNEDRVSVYQEVSDKEALDKIKQTLRFQIERQEGPHSRSGYLSTQKPSTHSSLTAIERSSAPYTAPQSHTGVAGCNLDAGSLLRGIDDQNGQMISNDQILRLLQGTADNHACTEPTPTGISNLGGVFSSREANSIMQNLDLSSLPHVFPHAISFNSNTSSSTLGMSSSASGERHQELDTLRFVANSLGYLPQQQTLTTMSLNGMPAVSSAFLASGRANPIALPQSALARSDEGRSRGLTHFERIGANDRTQPEMQMIIRQEELALLVQSIATHRLSTILREALNPPN
jgi:hypothetical protein